MKRAKLLKTINGPVNRAPYSSMCLCACCSNIHGDSSLPCVDWMPYDVWWAILGDTDYYIWICCLCLVDTSWHLAVSYMRFYYASEKIASGWHIMCSHHKMLFLWKHKTINSVLLVLSLPLSLSFHLYLLLTFGSTQAHCEQSYKIGYSIFQHASSYFQSNKQ